MDAFVSNVVAGADCRTRAIHSGSESSRDAIRRCVSGRQSPPGCGEALERPSFVAAQLPTFLGSICNKSRRFSVPHRSEFSVVRSFRDEMGVVAEAESSDNGVGLASEAAVSKSAPAGPSSQPGSADEPQEQMSIRRHSSNKLFLSHEFYSHFALPDSEPQNILERIVWYKEVEVDRMRNMVPIHELQKRLRDENPYPARNFLGALRNAATTDGKVKPALIAEVKKASPSKGLLREDFDPVEIGRAYAAAGASCMSVLTDKKFFQGGFENLKAIREEIPDIPLLCKDFMLYPYQLYVARLNGADAVLLIAAVLKDIDMQYFLKIAKAMRMTCLIEVHTLEEMDRVLSLDGVELIGINNRNLENFHVDIATTESIMAARLDQIKERGIMVVSESGLHQNSDLQRVQAAGCSAVLIGESLVTKPDPAAAIHELFQPC